MIEAVLFDLDGTLLDTLDDLACCGNHVLAQNGWPVHEAEAYKYFVGDGVAALVGRIVPEEARTPDELERVRQIFVEYYQEHAIDKTRPYDGVIEMLGAVKKRGAKTAVVSNKPDPATQLTVSHFFGGGAFDFVAGNRPGMPLKPDPAIANLAIGELGVSPGNCIFLGDTGMDMETAKNAGCIAVGVTWGFRKSGELLANGADHLINSPEELAAML